MLRINANNYKWSANQKKQGTIDRIKYQSVDMSNFQKTRAVITALVLKLPTRLSPRLSSTEATQSNCDINDLLAHGFRF